VNAITIKSIGDCTLAEITGLWNVGFQQLHGLTIFRRSGAFDCVPFRRERSDRYLCVLGMAEAVRALPFYLHRSAWMTQWFNARGSQSLIVYDRAGEVVG